MEDWQEDALRFHPADTQEVRDKHQHVRKTIRDAAAEILSVIPEDNRERSLFFTAIREAMMWANASIALNSPVVVQPSLVKKTAKK